MKKFQAPVIGGFRKMITLPPTSVGTTIAEVGAGTITLSQLAAAINNILQGSGSVTTGSAQAANLVLGPGLAGGGTLVGNVPLRLTAPIPWGIMEDGADGDMGPPGQKGATGSTGPQGPQGIPGTGGSGSLSGPVLWIPDDTSYDDFLIPGPAGDAGAVGATGPQGPAGTGSGGGGGGTVMFMIHDDAPYEDVPLGYPPNPYVPFLNVEGGALTVFGNGPTGNGGCIYITASSQGGIPAPTINMVSNGPTAIQATNSNQLTLSQGSGGLLTNISLRNAAIQYTMSNTSAVLMQPAGIVLTIEQVGSGTSGLQIKGAGGTSAATFLGAGIQVGAPSGGTAGEMGTGTINISKDYYINGVPIETYLAPTFPVGAYMAVAEDQYWEEEIYKGIPSSIGPTTVIGALTVLPHIYVANASAGLQVILASSSGVSGLLVSNSVGAFEIDVTGAGNTEFGSLGATALNLFTNSITRLAIAAGGAVVAVGPLGAQAATPAVTAGQTDIGVTTTATVITTAGGIALPALASTFWVVNVNGVKYGIPCFAL